MKRRGIRRTCLSQRTWEIKKRRVKPSERAWTTIDFGRHCDLTIPELILEDPSYFYWALANGVFKGTLAVEARTVAKRAKTILPPLKRRDQEFGFEFTAKGQLVGVKLLNHDEQYAVRNRTIVRTKHFSLLLVNSVSERRRLSIIVLLDWFRRVYFGGIDAEWPSFCKEFFFDRTNFER